MSNYCYRNNIVRIYPKAKDFEIISVIIYCSPRPMPWTLLDPSTGRPVETGNQRAKKNQNYETRRR